MNRLLTLLIISAIAGVVGAVALIVSIITYSSDPLNVVAAFMAGALMVYFPIARLYVNWALKPEPSKTFLFENVPSLEYWFDYYVDRHGLSVKKEDIKGLCELVGESYAEFYAKDFLLWYAKNHKLCTVRYVDNDQFELIHEDPNTKKPICSLLSSLELMAVYVSIKKRGNSNAESADSQNPKQP